MMKKTWSAAMAALMVGSLLSGCSGSKTAAPSTTAASSEAPLRRLRKKKRKTARQQQKLLEREKALQKALPPSR